MFCVRFMFPSLNFSQSQMCFLLQDQDESFCPIIVKATSMQTMNHRHKKDKNLKGWLRRKGGRMNTWSRRWFILSDKYLFMFVREDDSKSADSIALDEHIIVEPPVDLHEPKRVYFDIVTGKVARH